MNVVVLDTGCANLNSVKSAIIRHGYEPVVSREPEVVLRADKLFLPGVGTAQAAMDQIRERELVELIKACTQPVLGICRGMQLINVAFGGSLHQDIPTQFGAGVMHQADAYDMHSHGVVFTEGGQFARWFGSPGGGEVVSIHHQCVRALGRDLVVEATAPEDGMIEAIRHTGHRFVVGVQWHPEFHAAGATRLLDCAPLLDAFHQAARNAR